MWLRVHQFWTIADSIDDHLHRTKADLVGMHGDRTLRTLAIVQGAMNALFMAAMSIFVLLAVTVLHTGDLGFGLIMSAGALGGVLGSLAVPKLSAAVGGRATIIASIVATGVAFAGIGLVTQPLFTGALFMVVSASAAANIVVIASLRMRLVPNHLLGRMTRSVRSWAGYWPPPLGWMGSSFVQGSRWF